jgi:hypothetical protein
MNTGKSTELVLMLDLLCAILARFCKVQLINAGHEFESFILVAF